MEEQKRSGHPSIWLLNLLHLLEPLDLYLKEVKRIAALEPPLIDEKMRMIQEAGGVLSREMETRFESFTAQLEERKKELEQILNPSRPDPAADLRYHLSELSAAVEKITLRDQLTERWWASTPEEITRGYEEALANGKEETVELYEAYAEEVLKRRGDVSALAAFRERRDRELDKRLTPDQRRTKQELMEQEKLEISMRLMHSVISSILNWEAGAGENRSPAG
jgi:hypothetical protein